MNGVDLAIAIRKTHPSTRILLSRTVRAATSGSTLPCMLQVIANLL